MVHTNSAICVGLVIVGSNLLALAPYESGSQSQNQSIPVATPPQIASATKAPAVAVIPLRGSVGPKSEVSWFSAVDFDAAVKKAELNHIKTIILDIDSPGGYVSTEEEIIMTILKSSGRGITFVAFINENAASAAALISLACKHIYAVPTARIGAAATVLTTSEGTVSWKKAMEKDKELAAKHESFDAAVHASAAEITGRCACIASAMRDMKSELWWSPTVGLSPKKLADSTEQVDSNETILTLTAKQLERLGVGFRANNLNDVLKSLGLQGAKVVNYKSEMNRAPKELKRLVKRANDLWTIANSAVNTTGNEKWETPPGTTDAYIKNYSSAIDKIYEFLSRH